jgi:hypothetical protein
MRDPVPPKGRPVLRVSGWSLILKVTREGLNGIPDPLSESGVPPIQPADQRGFLCQVDALGECRVLLSD